MKKMFTLFVALISFSALFAQYDGRDYNGRNDSYNSRNNGPVYNSNNTQWKNNGGYDNHPDRAVVMRQDNGRMNDDRRRMEMDRINQDYDHRIDAYRNDRRMNSWERDRQIDQLRRERAAKLKAFGGGVLLGGVLGVLLGSQL